MLKSNYLEFIDTFNVLSGSYRGQRRKRGIRRSRVQSTYHHYVISELFVLVPEVNIVLLSQGQIGVDGERGRSGAPGQPVSIIT